MTPSEKTAILQVLLDVQKIAGELFYEIEATGLAAPTLQTVRCVHSVSEHMLALDDTLREIFLLQSMYAFQGLRA